MTDREELIAGRQLAHVNFDADYTVDSVPDVKPVHTLDEANLITSAMPLSARHKPVIDLDLPASLVPSSTPGHFHLYIHQTVSWEAYVKLLEAMRDAGLVQPGYVAATLARGFSSVRPPWVSK